MFLSIGYRFVLDGFDNTLDSRQRIRYGIINTAHMLKIGRELIDEI